MKFFDRLKSWLPVVLWMMLMFTASTDLLSSEHTSRYLVPFLRWLNPDISATAIGQIHFLVRKSGHLIEYGILAVLLWRALRSRMSARRSIWPQGAAAFVVAVIFAATDEYHQAFVPTRGSSPNDVLLDSGGAAMGLALRWAFGRRNNDTSSECKAPF